MKRVLKVLPLQGTKSACKASTTQPRAAPWVAHHTREIAPYRGKIMKRVLKVLPLQGDGVLLSSPTQGAALG